MSASARLAAASAVAASLFLTALPAASADLFEPPRGSAYDDPRYGDIYGDGPRYGYGNGPRYGRYAEPSEDFEPTYPPRAAFRDDDEDYDEHRYSRFDQTCVPRHVVHDRLRADGWNDFRDLEPRGREVVVQARRPSGRLFDLTIDRCSGEIVDARPLDGARDFASGPWRHWQRSY